MNIITITRKKSLATAEIAFVGGRYAVRRSLMPVPIESPCATVSE